MLQLQPSDYVCGRFVEINSHIISEGMVSLVLSRAKPSEHDFYTVSIGITENTVE